MVILSEKVLEASLLLKGFRVEASVLGVRGFLADIQGSEFMGLGFRFYRLFDFYL